MKKLKICSILLASFIGVGAMVCFSKIEKQTVETKADNTVYTIAELYGKKRPDANTLVVSANEVIGAQGDIYVGNVFDGAGNAMSLELKGNGGAGTDAWANGGTRRFDFNVGAQSFKTAIGDGSTFYITKYSVFTCAEKSISIKFAKDYTFTHIYDGSFAFAETTYVDTSFKIVEAEARPETAKFRVGVLDFSNLSAGFADVFKGEVKDASGNIKTATITDAASGSTSAGNRRVYIVLDSQASSNTFFIGADNVFYNANFTKRLVLTEHYKIANTTLSVCDGTNHSFVDHVCEVCGYKEEVIESKEYTLTHGTSNLYSTISVGDAQTEVNLKMGCTGLESGMAATYRGVGSLNGTNVNVKLTTDVTNSVIRLYIYLDNSTDGCTSGHLFIDENTVFNSDGATPTSTVKFSESFYIGYDNANHINFCDGSNHTYGQTSVVEGHFIKTCDGCGHVETSDVPIITPTLGTSYYSTITEGDPNYEISLKVSGCSNLDGAASTYRGVAKLDGTDINTKITISGTDMRFYIYVDKDSTAINGGHLFIDSNTKFSNDGDLASYLQFASCFYLGYDNAHHIIKCDGTNHTYGDATLIEEKLVSQCKGCGNCLETPVYTATLGMSDKWASVSSAYEVSIKIGGCSGLTGAASVYRGDALLNGNKQALKIQIEGAIIRIWMFLTEGADGVNNGVITIPENTLFKADGTVLSYLKFDRGIKISYNNLTNKYRVDEIEYDYVETVVSNVVNKNWIENTGSEISLSYNGVTLSNNVDTTNNIILYRGKALVDDIEQNVRVGLLKNNGTHKLVFYYPGSNKGTLKISKDQVFTADSNGTYFSKSDVKIADTLKFADDLIMKYDVENQLVNAKELEFSFSGVGAWSQQLDTEEYNSMASFNQCSVEGIYEDNSEINPATSQHRGYHFYGKGYDKNDETKEVPVDIWLSNFEDGDVTLNSATVKAAVYTKIESTGEITGIKLHKDDLFICSHYNMLLTLDDDYLIKWFVNSSRTTAGKYNNDTVGPTIYVDSENIPTFVEGDAVPTLPVAIEDDVDDIVEIMAQNWEEGAIDENNKLVAGEWTVTITGKDSSGNEAVPVEVTIKVKSVEPTPVDPEPTPEETGKKGCGGSIVATSGVVTLVTLICAGLICNKRKED